MVGAAAPASSYGTVPALNRRIMRRVMGKREGVAAPLAATGLHPVPPDAVGPLVAQRRLVETSDKRWVSPGLNYRKCQPFSFWRARCAHRGDVARGAGKTVNAEAQ